MTEPELFNTLALMRGMVAAQHMGVAEAYLDAVRDEEDEDEL